MSLKSIKDNTFIYIFILSLTVLLFYFGVWNAYFASVDDFGLTGRVLHKTSFLEALKGLGNGVRFLNYAHIWLKTRLFGLDASLYFWSSLLQHIVVTLIVYKLVDIWSQRRTVAFLAALLFTTKFSYYEIVTSVSASDYSMWAIFYLATLGFFSIYLQQQKLIFYFASIGAYAILSFAHDFTLSMPLVLLAYHLTLGLGPRPVRSFNWGDIKLHFPYWIFWSIHVSIQLSYIILGTSEAVYSPVDYGPGLHMFSNLQYLIFIVVPNVLIPPIYNFVTGYIGPNLVAVIINFSIGLAVLGNIGAVIVFWKGTSLVRFSVALIYLPFLQYTLWHGDFAAAPRYLYFPSIGFSILLALFLVTTYKYLSNRNKQTFRFVVPGMIIFFILLANLLVIQTWVQRHVENGKFRQSFVTQLASDFQDVPPNTYILIEVPADKFKDLEYSCLLVLPQSVRCIAFVEGEHSLDEVIDKVSDKSVYWLKATNEGLDQVHP